jgi:hypothetical protein
VKPQIVKTRFGRVVIQENGERIEYKHDVLIRLDGKVCKRKKKLSKQVYGTSHKLSLAEARHVYEEGAEMLLIGTGVFGRVRLSDEAADFFREKAIQVELRTTPKAAKKWNKLHGRVIGLFHVAC